MCIKISSKGGKAFLSSFSFTPKLRFRMGKGGMAKKRVMAPDSPTNSYIYENIF
jgi:hypothetical protein